jgi:hypothetical protein
MRKGYFACVFLLIAGCLPAVAQTKPPAAAPYKAVAVTLPVAVADPAFEAMRKQLGEIAQRKDRAALTALIVGQGFFWDRDKRDGADKRKSGFDNLATALALNNKTSAGWEILFSFTDDPTAAASPAHKNALCAPGEPGYKRADYEALLKATQTDASDWGYPVSAGIEVRATPQANSAVVEKLGLNFVRVSPGNAPVSAAYLRIITPDGKAGFVSVDEIATTGGDQLCYVKDNGAWKIGGYIGGGEAE